MVVYLLKFQLLWLKPSQQSLLFEGALKKNTVRRQKVFFGYQKLYLCAHCGRLEPSRGFGSVRHYNQGV